MPRIRGNSVNFSPMALTRTSRWITVPRHAVARYLLAATRHAYQRREDAPRGRRMHAHVRLSSRTGSSYNLGWTMNRLATQTISYNPPPASSKSSIPLPLDGVFSSSELGQCAKPPTEAAPRPSVFCPLHYERGYAYPLVVWLHDGGESEHVLRQIVPRISLRNYVAVGPRGTASGDDGYTWQQDADHAVLADERVLEAIQFVRDKLHVSKRRVFIAGRGAGGTMALRLAFEHPQRFAGAISIDGPLPRQGLPLARVNELRRLPVLLSFRIHASLDRRQLGEDERLLHAAGMHYLIERYPGHNAVLPQILSDLDRWLMSHVCRAPE